MFRALLIAGGLCLPVVAIADTFVDDFEGGTNFGGWSYNPGDVLESTGGNPGWWLHNDYIDSFAPIFVSDWNVGFFTGDYRAMGVTQISFDARLLGYSVPIEMSILLRDTNGTPGDVDDDDYAYFPGALIPPGDGTWVHYDFVIPSQDVSPVPAGWFGGWVGDFENFRPGVDWNDVVTSVDRVEIWFWHPAYFGIFAIWDAGLDNIAITSDATVGVEPTAWGAIKSLYR
jgi:hypothetical protein